MASIPLPLPITDTPYSQGMGSGYINGVCNIPSFRDPDTPKLNKHSGSGGGELTNFAVGQGKAIPCIMMRVLGREGGRED